MNSILGQLVTAMITPFTTDDNVNYAEAIRIAQHLIDTGTDTILLTGTTGESPTLTHDEEFELFRTIVKEFKGKAKIMVGTGSNSTRTAIASTVEAEKIGVDASLQVVPYYNKPSQEGMYRHFKAIAASTKLPIMLYNIPGRTATNMEPETIARCAEIPNIVAVKEAAGSVEQVAKIRALCPEDFLIYSGDDGLTLDFMEKGASGVVSVAAHIAGAQIKEMVVAFANGQKDRAREIEKVLMPLFEVLFINTNPAPLKAAMNMMGFGAGHVRLPLVDVTVDEKDKISEVLRQMRVL